MWSYHIGWRACLQPCAACRQAGVFHLADAKITHLGKATKGPTQQHQAISALQKTVVTSSGGQFNLLPTSSPDAPWEPSW